MTEWVKDRLGRISVSSLIAVTFGVFHLKEMLLQKKLHNLNFIRRITSKQKNENTVLFGRRL